MRAFPYTRQSRPTKAFPDTHAVLAIQPSLMW